MRLEKAGLGWGLGGEGGTTNLSLKRYVTLQESVVFLITLFWWGRGADR